MVIHYIKKMIALSLIFSLGSLGFPWHSAFAYFSDTEATEQNSIALGSLDFSLASENNFDPLVTPTQSSSREITVIDDGTIGFQYKITVGNFAGNSALCNALSLAVSLGGDVIYNGSLVDFELPATTDLGNYHFEATLTDDNLDLQNKTCSFDFIYTGWQDNLPDDSAGFSDTETIANTINSGSWQNVVLNEILPNPEGDDDQVGLQGEWVELYNNSDHEIDLTGWYIEDASSSGHRQTISSATTFNGRTVIGAQGSGLEWLVLFMDGAVLNNTGDTVTLYTADGHAVDSYSFTASVNDDDSDSNNTPGGDNENPTGDETAGNEGKSYARIPDGVGDWVDPVPTPGGPNILNTTDGQAADDRGNYYDLDYSDNQSSIDDLNGESTADDIDENDSQVGGTVDENNNNDNNEENSDSIQLTSSENSENNTDALTENQDQAANSDEQLNRENSEETGSSAITDESQDTSEEQPAEEPIDDSVTPETNQESNSTDTGQAETRSDSDLIVPPVINEPSESTGDDENTIQPPDQTEEIIPIAADNQASNTVEEGEENEPGEAPSEE